MRHPNDRSISCPYPHRAPGDPDSAQALLARFIDAGLVSSEEEDALLAQLVHGVARVISGSGDHYILENNGVRAELHLTPDVMREASDLSVDTYSSPFPIIRGRLRLAPREGVMTPEDPTQHQNKAASLFCLASAKNTEHMISRLLRRPDWPADVATTQRLSALVADGLLGLRPAREALSLAGRTAREANWPAFSSETVELLLKTTAHLCASVDQVSLRAAYAPADLQFVPCAAPAALVTRLVAHRAVDVSQQRRFGPMCLGAGVTPVPGTFVESGKTRSVSLEVIRLDELKLVRDAIRSGLDTEAAKKETTRRVWAFDALMRVALERARAAQN